MDSEKSTSGSYSVRNSLSFLLFLNSDEVNVEEKLHKYICEIKREN